MNIIIWRVIFFMVTKRIVTILKKMVFRMNEIYRGIEKVLDMGYIDSDLEKNEFYLAI